MFFQDREGLREALLSANEGDVSISGLTLPLDSYRDLGREHQFAVELQLENKSRMDLKVLDDEEDSGAYYVYVATTEGNFIDAWGFYDSEDELLQKYRMRLFRKGRNVPSRLLRPSYSTASRLKSRKLKPFIGVEWDSDDLGEGDGPDETDFSDDDLDYDGTFIDLSTLERDRLNLKFMPSIEMPLDSDAIDESNRLFRIRGQSEEMRAIELANLWEDFEEREICMACGEYMSNCKQDEMQFGCKPRKYPRMTEEADRWAIVRKRSLSPRVNAIQGGGQVVIEMEPGSSLEDTRARKEQQDRYEIGSFFEGDVKWMQNRKGDVYPVLRSTGQRVGNPGGDLIIKKIISGGRYNEDLGKWEDYKLSRRTYRRNINDSQFIGTQSTFTKDKARTIAGWVRSNRNLNARVIPSSEGYRIYFGKRK